MKTISSSKQLRLNQQQYVALIFGHVTIPGDERSRNYPGHGYPEHTEDTVQCYLFDSFQELDAWVVQREAQASQGFKNEDYCVMEVHPLEILRKVEVGRVPRPA